LAPKGTGLEGFRLGHSPQVCEDDRPDEHDFGIILGGIRQGFQADPGLRQVARPTPKPEGLSEADALAGIGGVAIGFRLKFSSR
jgi:hypothetical protein